jgi:hypothetical protein
MLSESQKAEREERLRLMSKSLIEGRTPTDIVRRAVEQFKITERQAWRDLKTIKARWKKDGKEHRLVNLHKAILRRNDLYRRCLADNDLRSALKVEQDIARLLSLYRAEEIKHPGGGPGGNIPVLSIEAIKPEAPAPVAN